MGVLNITPDSFSDGGQYMSLDLAMAQAKLLVSQGATILDIGGESTRPGATRVDLGTEQGRVIPVISALKSADWFLQSGALISVDTMNSQTAASAIAAGADIINDVSGGLADPKMFAAVAPSAAKYVLSHWRGQSDQMDQLNQYQDVATDVVAELAEQVAIAVASGISRDRIIVDPGLGFAKDIQQNWQLVARLDELEKLGLPTLVGASRKRFIATALDSDHPTSVDNQRRDLATAVLTALLLQRKLWGVRVHNVQATVDAIKMVEALRLASEPKPKQS
ncbi:MAG: dihydropteroate synthase [Micrococcales bacterium]